MSHYIFDWNWAGRSRRYENGYLNGANGNLIYHKKMRGPKNLDPSYSLSYRAISASDMKSISRSSDS